MKPELVLRRRYSAAVTLLGISALLGACGTMASPPTPASPLARLSADSSSVPVAGAAAGVARPGGLAPRRSAPHRPLEVGLAGGVRLADEFTSDDIDYALEQGSMFRLTGDYFPSENIGVGLFALRTAAEAESFGYTTTTGAGVSIKGRVRSELSESMDLLVTPGLGIGYLSTTSDADTVRGLGITLGLDLRLRTAGGFDVFLEPGLLWQPTGGNDDSEVTFGPGGYVMVGVGLAF